MFLFNYRIHYNSLLHTHFEIGIELICKWSKFEYLVYYVFKYLNLYLY